MARILIEVIYEQVGQDAETMTHVSELRNNIITFENDDRDTAIGDAEKEFDRIRSEGMYLSGGAVLKSLILPGAIKQVGLVDLDLFEELNLEASSTPAPADVPELAEVA